MDVNNRRGANKKTAARAASPLSGEVRKARREEYYQSCKRLFFQCYHTHVKLAKVRRLKEQYRKSFMEIPGILHISQQFMGLSKENMPEESVQESIWGQKAFLDTRLQRLSGLVTGLQAEGSDGFMTERQFAYNLNLDWGRLSPEERKKLRKRLALLLRQEEAQLAEEMEEEEFVFLKSLGQQLLPSVKLGRYLCTVSGREEYVNGVADLINHLKEAYGSEAVSFIWPEQAKEAEAAGWFLLSESGSRYPCMVRDAGKAKLLMYGRRNIE